MKEYLQLDHPTLSKQLYPPTPPTPLQNKT